MRPDELEQGIAVQPLSPLFADAPPDEDDLPVLSRELRLQRGGQVTASWYVFGAFLLGIVALIALHIHQQIRDAAAPAASAAVAEELVSDRAPRRPKAADEAASEPARERQPLMVLDPVRLAEEERKEIAREVNRLNDRISRIDRLTAPINVRPSRLAPVNID